MVWNRNDAVPDVVVVQMAMAAYRQKFIDAIAEAGHSVQFLVGDRQFTDGFVTEVTGPNVRRTGRNRFILGRRFGYQPGALWPAVAARIAVIETNPRNMTSWLCIMCRRILGRPTVGWGHVYSRKGASSLSNRLRQLMQNQCSTLIVYTSSEAEAARTFAKGAVVVAENSLYARGEMAAASEPPARDHFIWIGRLVPDKKPALLLDAISILMRRGISTLSFEIVGDGPERQMIEEAIAEEGVGHLVRIRGQITEVGTLRDIFAKALAMIATGYVGLNVTQSLGFGVPILYPQDEPHAPEVEALNASNSMQFEADNAESLADAIQTFARNSASWNSAREDIARATRERYSVEKMIVPFIDLAEHANTLRHTS